MNDDELKNFEKSGSPALPANGKISTLEHDGARLWYAVFGEGLPVILLHGGLGHSANFSNQVPALTDAGYQVILIDSRGHGRSTRDTRPFHYEQLASDVFAVMDELKINQAPMIGWSDGACTGIVMAKQNPSRISGVFFFACNLDPSGTKPFAPTPPVERCFNRHVQDYAELSSTPAKFKEFAADLNVMQQNEPNYSSKELAEIQVPVTLAIGEQDEFIKRAHMEYLAKQIPRAKLTILPGVSHFAPLQRPHVFNEAILDFLAMG